MLDELRYDGDGYYLKVVKTAKGYNLVPYDSDCDERMVGFPITVFTGDDAREKAIAYAIKTTQSVN